MEEAGSKRQGKTKQSATTKLGKDKQERGKDNEGGRDPAKGIGIRGNDNHQKTKPSTSKGKSAAKDLGIGGEDRRKTQQTTATKPAMTNPGKSKDAGKVMGICDDDPPPPNNNPPSQNNPPRNNNPRRDDAG